MDIEKYRDIIDLPHHQSSTRKRMSDYERAAQFAPFAALTGFDSAIDETGRLTEGKAELQEDEKSLINEKLLTLSPGRELRLTYFVPDVRKAGGAYIRKSGTLKKLDSLERCLRFTDGSCVYIEDILDIEL